MWAVGLAMLAAGASAALPPAPAEPEAGPPALDGASVAFAALAGLALPACDGQAEGCAGNHGPAPSVEGLVLYQPNRTWGFGVVGRLARLHWKATYPGPVAGTMGAVESDLTSAFVGLAGRVTLLSGRKVTPVFQIALGSAFQMQTGSNFNCNAGVNPTGQLDAGAAVRMTPSFAIFATASASGGIRNGCDVSDGPPATPFLGWGFGLHVGASFDVAIEPPSRLPPSRVAVR